MSSKLVLTASAAVFGIFGAGWLIVPEMFYKFWAIVPDPTSTWADATGRSCWGSW